MGAETVITYVDGHTKSKNIVGMLTWSDIGKSSYTEGNTTIKSVEIGTAVTSINGFTFGDCTSLTSVTIPNSVTSIYHYAFYHCNSLISITIPTSVTTIEDNLFFICSKLTSVIIPNTVTSIKTYAFGQCHSLTSIALPDSLTSIGQLAFADCESLTSATILSSVTTIGVNSFYGCNDLQLHFKNRSLSDVKLIENYSWGLNETQIAIDDTYITYVDGHTEEKSIVGELTYSSIGRSSSSEENTTIKSVEIGTSVTSISKDSFNKCTSLTSVSIPDSVNLIGNYAFYQCTSLTSVSIPDSVTSIGSSVFSNCTSLTSVSIPTSVTSIGIETFNNCTSLTSVSIPSSVTSIAFLAFNNCSSLALKFHGRSLDQVKAMSNYPWGLNESQINVVMVTIVFKGKDNDIIQSGSYVGGSTVTVPTPPTYSKYMFKKWNPAITGSTVIATEDMTYVAEYEKTNLYSYDDVILSVVADFNAKILNNSFTKLLVNDNTLIPENNYIPIIWEQKWFNNDAVPGYNMGQCVWRNTISSLSDFLSAYGDLVYDYASNNEKLGKSSYLSNSWSKLVATYGGNESVLSVQRMKYYNVISGYSDLSTNPETGQQIIIKNWYQPLFDYGNATLFQTDNSRIEVYVSTKNDNKELLSNRSAWKNIILSDQAAYNNYISTEVSILFDQHISAYHFNDELTPDNIGQVLMRVDFSNFNPDEVQKATVPDHTRYVDSEGFDYVVKFAKREDDYTVSRYGTDYTYKLYRWFRLWSSGHLEHGGVIPCGIVSDSKEKLKAKNYIISVDLGWETSAAAEPYPLQIAEVYDYTPLSSSFYGNVTGNLYYAKKAPNEIGEIYTSYTGNLGQASRYNVDITPVSFDIFEDLSTGTTTCRVKEIETLSANGSGYSTPLSNAVSSYVSIEVHHIKNNSFCFTKNNTDDIGKNDRIQFYQYYASGYKTSKFSSMSMERSVVDGVNETYEYTGESVSSDIEASIQVTTCTGKVLQKDVNYTLEFENSIEPGDGSVTVKGVYPFEGEQEVQFVIVE